MAGLKDLYKGQFEIGAALGGRLPDSYSPGELELIRTHFNNITPENCMKPQPIEPEEGRFDWMMADALVEFARAERINVTGHCLVWHSQCPAWFFKDGEKQATREMVLERMKRHIEAVLGRYRGKIQGWDVVNEAIDDGELYIRKSLWKETVGEDYVAKAFEFAQAADPQMPLYYNDYNDELPAKREKTVRLLKDLKTRGLRVDAVGIQGHWCLDKVPFKEIDAAIGEFANLGLDVMITELDLDVVERAAPGADVSAKDASAGDPFANGLPEEVAKRSAEQYAELFAIFRRHKDAISRVTFWGLHDGRSWLNGWPRKRTNHALLFDRQCKAKAAFAAVAR